MRGYEMDYTQLIESLKQVDALSHNLDFITMILILVAKGGLFLFISIFVVSFFIKEEDAQTNRVVRNFIVCMIAFFIVIGVTGHLLRNHNSLTLKEKQTVYSDQVEEWENDYQMQDYLDTLPTKTSEIASILYVNDKKPEQGYNVTMKDPYNSKKKIKMYVEYLDVSQITKADVPKGKPRKSYIDYHILPQDISHHYKKGKVVPVEVVLVDQKK